jgi:hypothetical protein
MYAYFIDNLNSTYCLDSSEFVYVGYRMGQMICSLSMYIVYFASWI